jgi:hypothetical protein
VSVDDERAGNQNVENRKYVEVDLEHQMTIRIVFVIVDKVVAQRSHNKDTDCLKQKDADEFFGICLHKLLGHHCLAAEPYIYTDHKEDVEHNKDEQHAQ